MAWCCTRKPAVHFIPFLGPAPKISELEKWKGRMGIERLSPQARDDTFWKIQGFLFMGAKSFFVAKLACLHFLQNFLKKCSLEMFQKKREALLCFSSENPLPSFLPIFVVFLATGFFFLLLFPPNPQQTLCHPSTF